MHGRRQDGRDARAHRQRAHRAGAARVPAGAPDYPKALEHHEAARVIARECEDISAEAAACLNCANTVGKMGDKERGMELQYEALGLRRKQVADAQLEIAEAKKVLDENPRRRRNPRLWG